MGKPIRILIVEDSDDDTVLLLRQLQRDGYNPVYKRVDNAQGMSEALDRESWDIVISDYLMPEFDGLAALALLKAKNVDTPCIITSGKITDEIAVAAMRAGARDYVMKDNLKRLGPVIQRELNEAVIRREHAATEELKNSMLLHAPNPILVYNPDTSIRFVNPAFEKLTGYTRKEIIGRKSPFPWWPEEERLKYENELQMALEKPLRNREMRLVNKAGETLWVEVTTILIRDAQGKLMYTQVSWIDITERKRLNEELEYYARKVTEAQEEERKRISRELHDDTAQRLSVLSLELDAFMHRNEQLPEAIADLKRIKENADRALEEVRRFSHELRPGILDQLGLLAAIDQLVEEIQAEEGPKIQFVVNGEDERLPTDIELGFFRIVQESLNNVRKHAQAERVDINLDFDPDYICLTVADNGKGFDKRIEKEAIANGHLGLIGIKERALLMGAQLRLHSEPGKGTTIRVELAKNLMSPGNPVRRV